MKMMKLQDWVPQDKINWIHLSENPKAIQLLEKNPNKIKWTNLSLNPNAIPLLEKNPEQIDWWYLSSNPAIFTYDYQAMSERCGIFKRDLMKNRFHPRHLDQFENWGFV